MVEILTIGTELLLGSTVDTNGAWLGARLADAGIRVTRRTTVPDDPGVIREALSSALARTRIVICTGGLGPTSDDFTRPVVAALYGVDLVLDRGWLDHVRARFTTRGIPMPPVNENQAMVPDGAMLLHNQRGTAPGLVLEHSRLGTTILLPGVPSEMRGLVEEHVLPYLVQHFGALRPIISRTLRTTGIAESAIQERVADLLETPHADVAPEPRSNDEHARATAVSDAAPGSKAADAAPPSNVSPAATVVGAPCLRGLPLALAFLPAGIGEDLRLTCWGELDADSAAAALDEGERLLRDRIGEWVYGYGTEDLAAVLGAELRRKGHTLTLAESCTGGMIAQRITAVSGASEYFVGGFVVYANELKQTLVGVSAESLEQHGAVSEPVARELAEGAARAARAHCAIAVTGIAGPTGGTPEKPVGTVWIAVTTPHGTAVRLHRFGGTREEIRARAAQAAMAMLLRELTRSPHAD